MPYTQLSPIGIPGERYSFLPKTETIVVLAVGKVSASFTSRIPTATFKAAAPGMSFIGSIPSISFEER